MEKIKPLEVISEADLLDAIKNSKQDEEKFTRAKFDVIQPLLTLYRNLPTDSKEDFMDYISESNNPIDKEVYEQYLKDNCKGIFDIDIHQKRLEAQYVNAIGEGKWSSRHTINIDDLGIDLIPKNQVIEVLEPPPRKAGIVVSDVDNLIDKLRNEAKVLK